jgi:hypothetical protein
MDNARRNAQNAQLLRLRNLNGGIVCIFGIKYWAIALKGKPLYGEFAVEDCKGVRLPQLCVLMTGQDAFETCTIIILGEKL